MKKLFSICLAAFMVLVAMSVNAQNHQRLGANGVVPAKAFSKGARTLSGNPDISRGIKPSPAEGTFSVGTPFKAPTGPQRISSSKGNIIGVSTFFDGMEMYDQASYGSVDVNTGKYVVYSSGMEFFTTDSYYSGWQGGFVRDGILYITNYSMEGDGTVTVYYNKIDVATGEYLGRVNMGGKLEAFCYTMTYDFMEDMVYGMSFDAQQVPNQIVKINPKTWEVTSIGVNTYNANKGTFIAGVAYNPLDGGIYGIRVDGTMVTIDKEDGDVKLWGYFDDDSWMVINPYSQPMCYSPNDRCFIAMVRDQMTGAGVCYAIDPESMELTYLSTMTNGRHCNVLCCLDAYAPDNAPALPMMTINHTAAELSGSIEIEVPSQTFMGKTLTQSTIQLDVKLDGTSLFSGQVAPGSVKTINFTTTEANHKFEAVCSIDADLVGPVAMQMEYIGNDTPLAPTNVVLSDNQVTWAAPGAIGVYGGYVDVNALTYNVYINNVKQNTTPITETSYTVDLGNELTAFTARVEAVANGHTSEKSEASNEILHGDALVPPYTMAPTYAESRLFSVVDANQDGSTWKFQGDAWMCSYNYLTPTVNDWLFLPVTNFNDDTKLYSVSFDIKSFYPYQDEFNDVEVFIGKENKPASMKKQLLKMESLYAPEYRTQTAKFAVEEAGTYYIGIQLKRNVDGSGVYVKNFSVNNLGSGDVPGDPIDMTVTPAEKGELKAILSWTAPTETAIGNALDASKEITFKVKSPGESEAKEVKVLPGQAATVDVATIQGFNNISVIPSNEVGEGIKYLYRIFTGIDTPKNVTGFTSVTSEDNLTMTLSWDPVTEGVNGGYIDPDRLYYEIYNHYSIYTVKYGRTEGNETTYDFTPGAVTMELFNVGARAVNGANEESTAYSTDITFKKDMLGIPYEVPMREDFVSTGSGRFNTYPWTYETSGEYSASQIEIFSDLSGLGLGITNDFEGSALVAFGTGGVSTPYEISIPKVNTKGHDTVAFGMRFWNHTSMGQINIYANHYGNEERQHIARILPRDFDRGQWVDYVIELPADFANCGWVHFWVAGELSDNYDAYAIFDKFEVFESVSHDFKISSLTGEAESIAGNKAQFCAVLENCGLEGGEADVRFDLVIDGEVSNAKGTSVYYDYGYLSAGEFVECYVDFLAAPEYVGKDVKVRATVVSSQNDVTSNDIKEMQWTINSTDQPAVTDLTGEWNDAHDAVTLSWSTPDATYGDYDSFEAYEHRQCTEQLGSWKNIDEDGFYPQFGITGLIDVDDTPRAWEVIDAKELGTMNDARLCPHSGNKYIMARSIAYNEETEEPRQNADWLISPEVVGGSTLGFWYGTISTQYDEYVELWASSTTDDIASFTKVRTFHKQGADSWEYVECKLPANAKYFALKYVGWGHFGAMLDDISFVPVNLLTWDIKHYNVYRDGALLQAGVDATSFVDACGDNNHYYNVTTIVEKDGKEYEGILSNTWYGWSTDIDDITALTGVYGEKGAIVVKGHAQEEMAVYGTDGKFIRLVTMGIDSERVATDAGVYIVKVGNAVAKVIVK